MMGAPSYRHCGGDVLNDRGEAIDLPDALELASIFVEASDRATNATVKLHLASVAENITEAVRGALRWRRCGYGLEAGEVSEAVRAMFLQSLNIEAALASRRLEMMP